MGNEEVSEAPKNGADPVHSDPSIATGSRPRLDMHKKKTLILSVPERLEGLAALLLALSAIVFLVMSAHTLYEFPTPDSYRWYGDETITWMLLGWKSMVLQGRLVVPIALESALLHPPGLLLGSPWLSAFVYGIPQVLFPPKFDPVSIGRTVSFVLAIATLALIAWMGYRSKWRATVTILAIALLVSTRALTFASHSARYDMITGFAVLSYALFFATRVGNRFSDRPVRSTAFAFWFGFLTMLAGLTISVHTGALIILPAIFFAWYFGLLENLWNLLSTALGAAVGFALLSLLYLAINHQLVFVGLAAGGNQANAYLQHLPITHPFSWSAQSHQLGAKLFYLWHEAPPFAIILPLIAVSEILLLILRKPHSVTLFLTISLACVLLGATYFQSTLPYYLSHFLPLTVVTFAAHVHEWTAEETRSAVWLRPIVALGSLVLVANIFWIWLPELSNAGRMGKQLDDANTAAVEAAVEFASRSWAPGMEHPVVLAQAPAIHELLRDTGLRPMSEAFLFFPLHSGESVDSVIHAARVDYILDYNKPMTAEYDRVVRNEEPIFRRAGPLLDRTLDYFHDTTSERDTLTMYQVDTTR